MPTNYTVTTTPATFTLSPGDTLTVPQGYLVAEDDFVGSGSSELDLTGAGAFDLTLPATLTGFSSLVLETSGQLVTLRDGLPMAVTVADAGGGETVTLANAGDSFNGGSTGSNYILATTLLMNDGATVNGGSGGGSVLEITDSNATVNAAQYNISNIPYLFVYGDNDIVNPVSPDFNAVYLLGTGDQASVTAAVPEVDDFNTGNTVQFGATSGTLVFDPASGDQSATVSGFVAGDAILLQNLASVSSTSFDSSTDVLDVIGTDSSGDPVDDALQLQGASGPFALSPEAGGGFILTTTSSQAVLTTGADTVTGSVSSIIATDGTLSSGDVITPNPGAALELLGPGTFDLTAPEALSGISQVDVDGSGANVTLLNNLLAPVLLPSGGGDTITLADDEGAIDGNGGANDIFQATGYQADTASIAAGPYADLVITASAEAVTLSPTITGLAYATLVGGAASFNPGPAGPFLVYVESSDLGGADVVQLTGLTTAAVDYGDALQPNSLPDSYFFTPGVNGPGSGDTLTISSATAPTENLYGFDDTATVVLAGFSSIDAATGLTVASDDAAIGGAPGVLVTITGMVNGATSSESLQLYGDYTAADFAVTPPSPAGGSYTLTYSGSVTVDSGTQSGNQISGVPDIYLASDQLQGGDRLSTDPGGTLTLVGAGSFELNEPAAAITGVAQIDSDGPDQTITLDSRMGDVTLDIGADSGSAGHDVIYNLTDATTVVDPGYGYNYATTTSDQVNGLNADLGGGNGATISQIAITDQGYSLVLTAPNLHNVETFDIVENGGITFSTGSYTPAPGYAPVNVDISGGGGTLGGDTVTLTQADDTVVDYSLSNTLSLLGANQTVYIEDTATGASDSISGFDQGLSTNDVIDYSGASQLGVASSVSGGETTLTLQGQAGGNDFTQTLVLDGDYYGTFATQGDGQGGSEVVYLFCFLAGTAIRAPNREVMVEDLKPGDLVVTGDGAVRPVRWVGVQTLASRFADPIASWPIRIRQGALGEGLPRRDLLLSPGHALFLDGVLVQAGALVDGVGVLRHRPSAERITYFHVELAEHALIVAEGVLAETFLDAEDPAVFDNAKDRPGSRDDFGSAQEMAFPRVRSRRQLPRSLQRRLSAAAADAQVVAPAA